MQRHEAREVTQRRRDAGMTLPEMLISIVIMGVLMTAATASVTAILRTTPATEQRVQEARDASIVQTWLTNDLASANATDDDPAADPTTGNTLPGTNVLTIQQSSVAEWGLEERSISYRYEKDSSEDRWLLVRYDVQGTTTQTVDRLVVARDLATPPVGWTVGSSASHAVSIATSSDGAGNISQSLSLYFAGGADFTASGTKLAVNSELLGDEQLSTTDAGDAISKCGGTLTMVLDTSWSIPLQSGGEQLKAAALSFINNFTGTPVEMSVVGFDRSAYPMGPSAFGGFVSLLEPSADLTAMQNRISLLDNIDGLSYWDDPNGDGIHWSQIYPGGTNWEDGLYAPFFASNGDPRPSTPDLVVFITDGQPNQVRTASTQTDPLVAAQVVANQARQTGSRVIGVMVGGEASNPVSVSNLKAVVGSVEFDPAANSGQGNASSADYFTAAFTDVGTVLRQIMVAQCGGTITLQKKIDDNGVLKNAPKNSVWTFTTDLGSVTLDTKQSSSVNLDYTFPTGQSTRTVRVVEDSGPANYTFDRIECTRNGVAVPSKVTQPIVVSGQTLAGADIRLAADEALSCVVISKKGQ